LQKDWLKNSLAWEWAKAQVWVLATHRRTVRRLLHNLSRSP
jgi:hypothetical protein